MQLTDSEIGLIRDSHRLLITRVLRIGEEFYQDFFNRAPQARPLFSEDVKGQGMRFMEAVSLIVDNLEDFDAMEREIDRLAQSHGHLEIRRTWYREMQEALIDTFAASLGELFTNEMELAWRSAFSQICDRMMEISKPIG